MATPAKSAKTTKTPSPAAASAAATPVDKKAAKEAKEAKERAAQADRFKYLGKVVEGAKKLAPQAQGIVNLIQAAGKGGISRVDLVKNMEGVITTRQPLGRILSYYQQEIVAKGYVTMDAVAAPAPKKSAAAEDESEDGESEE